jgi:hypothetical protein
MPIPKIADYTLTEKRQLGSCPAAIYQKTGSAQRYYIKFPAFDIPDWAGNEVRACSEVLAAKLMQLICAPDICIPDYSLLERTIDGKKIYAVVSPIVETFSCATTATEQTDNFALLFLVSAFLNNYDAVQVGNYGQDKDGKLVAIDFGGALATHANPSSGDIFKELPYAVVACDSMADSKQNAAGKTITFTTAQLEIAAKRIVAIFDDAIKMLTQTHGYGPPETRHQLAEAIIRRKYFIAQKYNVLPPSFNHYSPIAKILNFLAKSHLYFPNSSAAGIDTYYQTIYASHQQTPGTQAVARIRHGIEHGLRAALLIQILHNLYRKHDPDGKPLIADIELFDMLLIGGILHDSRRVTDDRLDTAENEKNSAELCYTILIKLGFDAQKSKLIKLVIIHKDDPAKLKESFLAEGLPTELLDAAEACCSLLCQADSLDFLRAHNTPFQFTYQDFFNKAQASHNTLACKDFLDILEALKQAQTAMGDSPQSLHIEQTLPDGTARKIEQPGSFSLAKKEYYTNSEHPYEAVLQRFNEQPVLKSYLDFFVTAIQVFANSEKMVKTVAIASDQIELPGEEIPEDQLPYAKDLRLDNKQFFRSNKPRLYLKGSRYSPDIVLWKLDGFPPQGILSGHTLATAAMDLTTFRDMGRNDGVYISATTMTNTALQYAYNDGYCYVIISHDAICEIPNSVAAVCKYEVNMLSGVG